MHNSASPWPTRGSIEAACPNRTSQRISQAPLHGFNDDGLSCPGPCAINCTNNNEAFGFHPGGVDALFVDGGVRFLVETIPIATYAALVTRAGKEVVSNAF